MHPDDSTCSKDLTVEALDGHHGNRAVLKETHQAEITEILQLDALLVTLGHSLAFEKLEQDLPKPKRGKRAKVRVRNRAKGRDEARAGRSSP